MVAIYQIDRISNKLDYCLVEGEGTVAAYAVSRGIPFDRAPPDFRDAQLTIDDDEFGLELTDLLGCTNTLLLLRDTVFEALQAKLRLDPIETHRFRLLNGRGRVHSDDYLIVNPLDPTPCLSLEHADFLRSTDGSRIMSVATFVLISAQLPDRDLFRVAEKPQAYFVTQAFVDAVAELGYTNFTFDRVSLV